MDKNLGTIPSGKFAVHTPLFSKIEREISNIKHNSYEIRARLKSKSNN